MPFHHSRYCPQFSSSVSSRRIQATISGETETRSKTPTRVKVNRDRPYSRTSTPILNSFVWAASVDRAYGMYSACRQRGRVETRWQIWGSKCETGYEHLGLTYAVCGDCDVLHWKRRWTVLSVNARGAKASWVALVGWEAESYCGWAKILDCCGLKRK